jgi:VanZ family protein
VALPASIVRGLRATPRWVAVLLLVAWAAAIFTFSAQSPEHLGIQREKGRAWMTNLAHAPEYGFFALCFIVATADRATKLVTFATAHRAVALLANRRRLVAVLLCVAVYAISDEYHQSFTPGRDPSVCDILTDLCGAWLVAALVRAAEEGANAWRCVRILAIGLLACALAALIATFVPEKFPESPWL